MKHFIICLIFALCLIACSSDGSKCWTIHIEAFGFTEERLFWGTDEEVSVEAQVLRDIAKEKNITAQIYFEPSDLSHNDCSSD